MKVISGARSVNLRFKGDWRGRDEFDLIDVQDVRVGIKAIVVIDEAVLFGCIDALSSPSDAATADTKYQRIVADELLKRASVRRVRLFRLLFDRLGAVAEARRHDVHLYRAHAKCHLRSQQLQIATGKLEQLRVGQFSGLYLNSLRTETIRHR